MIMLSPGWIAARTGPEKTTCARCPTHCYKSAMRAQIKVVMRYAGRRMLLRHPVLALLHMLDAWRRPSKQSRMIPNQALQEMKVA